MRRTLLSSVPGAAVTKIRFTSAQAAGPEGGSVLHEFSAIEGVKEDVTDIILNIPRGPLRLRRADGDLPRW